MSKKSILKGLLGGFLILMVITQFIPSTPVIIPANIPADQRADHRLLKFEGIANFRDLGGYQTTDNRRVKWGKLYRSGTFAEASRSDLRVIPKLHLSAFIDFRSAAEKEEEPNVLPEPTEFRIVEIPTLDGGNNAMVTEVIERVKSGNFVGFDPNAFMLEANRQFASQFTPQFKEFIDTVLNSDGAPVLWHCTAGKDRTGFASAILLKILGVPQDTIMTDYMASKSLALAARKSQLRLIRLFKGNEAASKVSVMMGVEKEWLNAAFEEIDREWGSFDAYVANGLQLSSADIEQLKSNLLEKL